jgi:RecB family endonuclease NucS
MLELAGKEYRFLSSQLTFRKNPSLEIKGEQHRHVDLVLYDEEEGCLVVLELKRQADSSSLCEAKNELRIYVNEINRLIKNEKTAVLEAFNLKVVKGVIGYIVCPEYDADIQELALDSYGLIEYAKGPEPWEPWRKFKDAERTGEGFKIEFSCRKPAQMDS